MSAEPVVHVAVGVLEDLTGRILLARRHADTHQGNLWEFPGGKLEAGETAASALKRELQEELGIRVTGHRPLIQVRHAYPDRNVLLDVHWVTDWQGVVTAIEGQPLAWVQKNQLVDYPMPQADLPLVKAIQLPDTYLITDPVVADARHFLGRLQHALEQGVSLVQFRVFECKDGASLQRLAADALQLCTTFGAQMLINQDVELAKVLGAHGIHLNRAQLMALERRPLSRDFWIAASCHGRDELARAESLGVDFAVLSPVLPTSSHPHATPLGWNRFTSLIEDISLPVYALGGMQPDMMNMAWQHGAQGIAGITGLVKTSPQD